jgi:hypothetical protein
MIDWLLAFVKRHPKVLVFGSAPDWFLPNLGKRPVSAWLLRPRRR